jgi:hypothetical protein
VDHRHHSPQAAAGPIVLAQAGPGGHPGRICREEKQMMWFWLNVPLMLVFFGLWSGIPLWLTLTRWNAELNAKNAEVAARIAAAPVAHDHQHRARHPRRPGHPAAPALPAALRHTSSQR